MGCSGVPEREEIVWAEARRGLTRGSRRCGEKLRGVSYSQEIDARVWAIVAQWGDLSSRRMFGGMFYLVRGKLVFGVYKDALILRLGEKGTREALRSEYARQVNITGKPMRGWVMMQREGFSDREVLEELLNEAREFVEGLSAE